MTDDLVRKPAVREMLSGYDQSITHRAGLLAELDALPSVPALTEAEIRERLTDEVLMHAIMMRGASRNGSGFPEMRESVLAVLFPKGGAR